MRYPNDIGGIFDNIGRIFDNIGRILPNVEEYIGILMIEKSVVEYSERTSTRIVSHEYTLCPHCTCTTRHDSDNQKNNTIIEKFDLEWDFIEKKKIYHYH